MTHLPRRAAFYNAVADALPEKKHTALITVKIGQLRETNQTFGFDAGDAVLCRVAETIEALVNEDEMVGRVGGCRFSALLSSDDFAKRAQTIIEQLTNDDHASDAFAIDVNVGIVPILDDLSLHQLVMLGDEASLQARNAGGNMMVELTEEAVHTMLATHSLQSTAIVKSRFEADRFVLLKQIILSPDGKDEFGHEVFIQPPEVNRRQIDRHEFFRHVSRLRLRSQIDQWILNRASALNAKGRCIISVTAPRADNENYFELAETIVKNRSKSGGSLAFQIDEKAFTSTPHAKRFAKLAREIGAEVIIDEFTGQRLDFSELRKIPAFAVKLDAKFLRSIHTHAEARAMMSAVCELANAAGLKTIAKEVDRFRWVKPLREIGVDFLQGDAVGSSASASHFG